MAEQHPNLHCMTFSTVSHVEVRELDDFTYCDSHFSLWIFSLNITIMTFFWGGKEGRGGQGRFLYSIISRTVIFNPSGIYVCVFSIRLLTNGKQCCIIVMVCRVLTKIVIHICLLSVLPVLLLLGELSSSWHTHWGGKTLIKIL